MKKRITEENIRSEIQKVKMKADKEWDAFYQKCIETDKLDVEECVIRMAACNLADARFFDIRGN